MPISKLLASLPLLAAATLWTPGSAQADDAPPAPPAAPAATGDVIVPLTNLRNVGKGQLIALLYRRIDRVEFDKAKAFKRLVTLVRGKEQTLTFRGVPHGDYAVIVLHDMDNDAELDTTIIGIPDEDLGISRNAKGGPLGGPKWKECKVTLSEASLTLAPVIMKHFYD